MRKFIILTLLGLFTFGTAAVTFVPEAEAGSRLKRGSMF